MMGVVKRVARAIDPAAWVAADQKFALDISDGTQLAIRRSKSLRQAEDAIKAHMGALAEAGQIIHRFHDWKPQPGWPYDERARILCTRCGTPEDGLGAHVTSCPVPKAADVPD